MPSRARAVRRRPSGDRSPPNDISPDEAGSRPMMHFSSVVLPMPLRPMRQVRDPAGTSRFTSHSVWLPPYDWLSAWTASTVMRRDRPRSPADRSAPGPCRLRRARAPRAGRSPGRRSSGTKSMSCSTTTTECLPASESSSSAVRSVSCGVMPATGSSMSSSSGCCISSMPISSHCFWPCDERPRQRRALAGQADHLQHLVDALALRRA